jgi:shikimate kinase
LDILLVGFMGTGKSVVGKRLAARLERPFIDLDEQIAAAAGQSIPEIFAAEGETGFRDRETAALRALIDRQGAGQEEERVIATGGGILGREENVALLRRLGTLVCLTARPDVIVERTRPWDNRPMLARAPDPAAAVECLLAARASRYALAGVTIDTSDRDIDGVVEEICSVLT